MSNAYFDKGSGKYIQLQGTSQVAVEYDPKKHSSLPDGFGVINVDLDPEDSAPVSVTVRDWKNSNPTKLKSSCTVESHQGFR